MNADQLSPCRSSVLEATTRSPSPLHNLVQPVQRLGRSSRLDVMLQLPAGHSLAARSVPGRGHRVASQESIPCTLVLLRGRAVFLEELL